MATINADTGYDASMRGRGRTEGRVARAIETKTSRLPSDLFLWAAGASIVGSLLLQTMRSRAHVSRGFFGFRRFGKIGGFRMGGLRRFGGYRGFSVPSMPTRGGQLSLFLGQWAPTFLLLGIYNKLVKVAGSDQING